MEAFGKGALDLAYIACAGYHRMERGVPVICVAGGHMEGTVMAGKSTGRAIRTL